MVRRGVDSLVNMGAKGIIFDLRFNPGGLLGQARDVASTFLPKGKLVVFTKGRIRGSDDSLFTQNEPALPADMPVVVMVNRASASAAEIVSGAIQDWDRGVVFGDTSYGKGSVQRVFPIDEDHHLKMTMAFYYTPSGRCINKPENGIRGDDDEETSTDADSVDTTKDVEREIYYTDNKRPVFGGGGIIPDTIVTQEATPFIVRKLLLKDLFFKFANKIAPKLEADGIKIDTSYQISDKMLAKFYSYLDSSDFDYSIVAEDKIKDFKVYVGFEEDTTIDSTALSYVSTPLHGADSTKMNELLNKIDKLLLKKRSSELKDEQEQIKNLLRMALIIHQIGQDNDYIYRQKLNRDEQLESAIKLINSPEEYNKLLQPKKKKRN
jgi:carboxyl-terminal processing protease